MERALKDNLNNWSNFIPQFSEQEWFELIWTVSCSKMALSYQPQICVFVFAYADCWFSDAVAHIKYHLIHFGFYRTLRHLAKRQRYGVVAMEQQ